MTKIIDLPADQAKIHFLKGSSYFNGDFPEYISFEPILNDVASVLGDKSYLNFKKKNPDTFPNVNYNFETNKDGRFSWRPIELIHPAIYVSIVNLICDPANWAALVLRMQDFSSGSVECCSSPLVSLDTQSDKATQVSNWWSAVEQQSIINSMKFTHMLQTDVSDCYGSIYTHSISWAIDGLEIAKISKGKSGLLGEKIDFFIRACRYGQTNGIPQGSVLMDFIAEIVLGYVDKQITTRLTSETEFKILRYRDDYRIYTNNDERAEIILKTISDCLRAVGMKLNTSKTFASSNVVEGSVKSDKLEFIGLQDMGVSNASTIQKQLLRLHAFGRKYPNSGMLRRQTGSLYSKIYGQKEPALDLEVQVAIAMDIAIVSPQAFPAIAAILSHLISLTNQAEKVRLWSKVRSRMARVPYNGHLEIWLQRIMIPTSSGLSFVSKEPICQIINGEVAKLWENDWIQSKALLKALDVSKILTKPLSEVPEEVNPKEIELFIQNAYAY